MDPFNPIVAETYVKRIPFWQTLLGMALAVGAFLIAIWAVTVFLFSLGVR